jgi:hypothetical protein
MGIRIWKGGQWCNFLKILEGEGKVRGNFPRSSENDSEK